MRNRWPHLGFRAAAVAAAVAEAGTSAAVRTGRVDAAGASGRKEGPLGGFDGRRRALARRLRALRGGKSARAAQPRRRGQRRRRRRPVTCSTVKQRKIS